MMRRSSSGIQKNLDLVLDTDAVDDASAAAAAAVSPARSVGRPRSGTAMSGAERQKLRRERLKASGKADFALLHVDALDVVASGQL